jgi:NACHT domain
MADFSCNCGKCLHYKLFFNKCINDLLLTDPTKDLAAILRTKGKRVDGTCEWLLKREEYTSWLRRDGPQLLRLTGAPGIGKMMILSFLVWELERREWQSPSVIAAYYFCDYKREGHNTAMAILKGLICQLLAKRPALYNHIETDYLQRRNRLFCDVDELWTILLKILNGLVSKICFLIDALDEYDRSLQQAFFTLLREFLQLDGNQNMKVKFIITYRPERDIQEFDIGGHLRISSEEVKADFSKYIQVRVDDLFSKKNYPTQLKELIEETLCKKAGRTFLWVSLVLKSLKEVTITSQVEDELQTLLTDLNRVYNSILSQIDARYVQVTKSVLCLVAMA